MIDRTEVPSEFAFICCILSFATREAITGICCLLPWSVFSEGSIKQSGRLAWLCYVLRVGVVITPTELLFYKKKKIQIYYFVFHRIKKVM